MKVPQLRTPFARAVVPVAAGIGFFIVFGLVLWGVAAWISGKGAEVNLGSSEFAVERVDRLSDTIAKSGPLLVQGLKGNQGERSIVIDHVGNNDFEGWNIYWASPAGKPATCVVTQQQKTRTFTDCDGDHLTVDQLRPAVDVTKKYENNYLTLVLPGATVSTTAATIPPVTTSG